MNKGIYLVVGVLLISAVVILSLPKTNGPVGGNGDGTPGGVNKRNATSGQVWFAVIGDYGSGEAAESHVAALVKSWSPDFIVTVGDNNYPAGSADTIDHNIGSYYHAYIDPYSGAYGSGSDVNRFFPALGNHDWETADAKAYLDYFVLPGNERYYDFAWGPVHLYCVDSDQEEPNGTSATSAQAQWLETRMGASAEPWRIVYFHNAPYTSGDTHGSSTWMRWPFQRWGATAVLSGHEHNYERLTENGIPYFVDGTGGESLYGFGAPISGSKVRFSGDYGAMLVKASSTSIEFMFYTYEGRLVDDLKIDAS